MQEAKKTKVIGHKMNLISAISYSKKWHHKEKNNKKKERMPEEEGTVKSKKERKKKKEKKGNEEDHRRQKCTYGRRVKTTRKKNLPYNTRLPAFTTGLPLLKVSGGNSGGKLTTQEYFMREKHPGNTDSRLKSKPVTQQGGKGASTGVQKEQGVKKEGNGRHIQQHSREELCIQPYHKRLKQAASRRPTRSDCNT